MSDETDDELISAFKSVFYGPLKVTDFKKLTIHEIHGVKDDGSVKDTTLTYNDFKTICSENSQGKWLIDWDKVTTSAKFRIALALIYAKPLVLVEGELANLCFDSKTLIKNWKAILNHAKKPSERIEASPVKVDGNPMASALVAATASSN